MKKMFILVSCLVVILVMSKVSFAQPEEVPVDEPSSLSVATIVAEVQPDGVTVWRQVAPYPMPFGYAPYPISAEGYPAYGIPYSYPRTPRRLAARLTPPLFQPHPLVAPSPVPVGPPPQPTVVYRPAPFKNFMALMMAPRPYIGYDPYVAYPPQ